MMINVSKIIKTNITNIKHTNIKTLIVSSIIFTELILILFCMSASNTFAQPHKESSEIETFYPVLPDERNENVLEIEELVIEQPVIEELATEEIVVEEVVIDELVFEKPAVIASPILVEKTRNIFPIIQGNKNKSEVCLTFDDGFDQKSIERTLSILKDHNNKATFFVIGQILLKNPDLWKQAIDNGHEICNHTYSHPSLSSLTNDGIIKEITEWEKAAVSVLGEEYLEKMKREFPYFRLPGGNGSSNERVLNIISSKGYTVIGWSIETYYSVLKHHNLTTGDSGEIAKQVSQHVVNNSQKGSIILLHFNKFDTLRLAQIIIGIKEKGYEIKPVSEVL